MNCDPKIKNRIHRCEGQMRGTIKMMEEGKDCKQILTQLSAIRSSIDKVMALIAITNLSTAYERKDEDKEEIEKAIELLLKTR